MLIKQKVPHKNVLELVKSLKIINFAENIKNMERYIMQNLITWKNRKDRKPLILLGARQVGKTYILKEFGKQQFENVAYINCDHNEFAQDLFAQNYDMKRIILTIGALTGQNIEPGKTLIIMDEIQELPRGLAALKYFCEDAREYHVAVAGSLLGLMLHEGDSYPVGKVNTLNMYPMTFEEFLLAKGNRQLADILQLGDWQLIKGLKTMFIQSLREYYFVGGMPEAVAKFVQTNSAPLVREIQNEILSAYDRDISKHAPTEQVIRINQVWHSIPSQLAKENKKFIYGVVKKGGRAKDYEIAIQWLLDAGLVHKVNRVTTASMPLKIHEDISAFKLYLLDPGLLGAMNNTPSILLLTPNKEEMGKGDFTENYVCCQLKTLPNLTLGYYSKDNSQLEIDFVVQADTNIIPIEVKAEENLQAKSLKTFLASNPNLNGIRFSMSDYREQDRITNVPLYGAKVYMNKITLGENKYDDTRN